MTRPRIAHVRAADLRHRLAAELAAEGFVRSAGWLSAVRAVPRHVFLPEFFTMVDGPGPTLWDPVTPQRCGDAAWLALIYTDDSLVTQLDGHVLPHHVDRPVAGNPTSSATMPRLVMRMWEDLRVEEGDRVLEIGTGTGYSTALGCRRLGDEQITSIEVDPGIAGRAAEALSSAGHTPNLIIGDGLAGHPAGAPYDRIIATCAVRHIPRPWIEQARPGGLILATLSGWLNASGLIRLTVTGPGTAEGLFLPGDVSFMMARPHTAPPIGLITDQIRAGGGSRAAMIGPDALQETGTIRLVAQLAAPGAQHIRVGINDDPVTDYLVDTGTGSYAALTAEGSTGWTVRQGGPARLWDDIEQAVTAWREGGEPAADTFAVTITSAAQTVTLDTPAGPVTWTLPQ